MHISILLGSLCISASLASSITWTDCGLDTALPILCGTLAVPLDYTDGYSNDTLTLQLVKLPAAEQPSKGSVLFNPGGPGDAARNYILDMGETISLMTGPQHDLIGFDPRGTGETIPFRCAAFGNLSLQTSSLQSTAPEALDALWKHQGTVAEECCRETGMIGEFVGTGFVARDMMLIVDALGEDGLLRFYGTSYGTVLGATVAVMFPDRIDKIVLDGVVNVDQYYSGERGSEVIDADSVFEAFFQGCVDSPNLCALAEGGSSAETLSNMIRSLLEDAKYHPIRLGQIGIADLALKKIIFSKLKSPTNWPTLSLILQALSTGNLTTSTGTGTELLRLLLSNNLTRFPEEQGDEALQGIRCSDSALRADSLAEIEPILRRYEAESYVFGDVEAIDTVFYCAQWNMSARGRYTGGFHNVRTRNPILFVGNMYDPITPLASAKHTRAGFLGSGLLTVNSYGHTSWAQPSLCAGAAIRAYFMHGTLPNNGTICEPDAPLFAPLEVNLASVLQPLKYTT